VIFIILNFLTNFLSTFVAPLLPAMVKNAAIAFLFPILVLITGNLHAQIPSDFFTRLESRKSGQGSVRIMQNPDIRNMVNLHLEQQRKINGIFGFKISIYIGSGQTAKKDAELTMSKFLGKYEAVKCDRTFEYPYWKVYVGAFRTKSEALMFLDKIEYDYPDAFIRSDIVAFPD
jgi:hypothetical protein